MTRPLRVNADVNHSLCSLTPSLGSAAALYAYAHGGRVHASVQLCGPASLRRALRRCGKAAGLGTAEIKHIGSPLEAMELTSLRDGMVHPALIVHDPDNRKVPVSESHLLVTAWPA